ncbi:hypothetical protein B0H15DRAFT_776460, partial [Mycena belliarum]
MDAVRAAKTRWCSVLDPVYEKREAFTTSKEARHDIDTALEALTKLPWDGALRGFRAGGSVEQLAHWFTKDWLRSDHEDQMLELLASDLGFLGNCIDLTFFRSKLAEAYSNPDRYRTDQGFRWLRRLGTAFATKDRTRSGTISNENENHWITLVIDAEKQIVGYGNGFRTQVPADLRKHLDWWLNEHLATKFKWVDIPVAQQTDPHSCGILAYFTLAHWFDPERFPLPTCTAAAMAEARIKMFLRIVRYDERNNFSNVAQDCEFTFVALPSSDGGDAERHEAREQNTESASADDSEYSADSD